MAWRHDDALRRIGLQYAATLGEPNDVPHEAIDDGPMDVGKVRPNLIPNLLAPIVEHLEARADSFVWGHSARGAYPLAELHLQLRSGLLMAMHVKTPCRRRS